MHATLVRERRLPPRPPTAGRLRRVPGGMMNQQSPGGSSDYYPGSAEMASIDRRVPPSPAEYAQGMSDATMMEVSGCGEAPVPTPGQPPSYPDSPLTIQTNLAPPMTPSAQFKVNVWQNRNFDSGVHTMTHSQAPSVLSMTSIHAPSMMSGVSAMADELARAELTDQQQQRFENIPVGCRHDYAKSVSALPKLINLMNDTDEVVVLKAVDLVQNIARLDDDERRKPPVIRGREVPEALRDVLRKWQHKPVILKMCLSTLFNICSRSQDQEALRGVIALAEENDWALLRDLIGYVQKDENASWRFATLILHSVVSERQCGLEALIQARRLGALHAVTSRLATGNSEKILSVVVELCRVLCDKDVGQKNLFLQLGGVQKLLNILNECQYENLLWRATQLLVHFSNHDPQSLVGCGAHATLCKKLSHGSPRVVNGSLECLRNISDVRCEDSDCLPLLSTLLQFLGNAQLKTVLYAVQIMGNMCANNKARKEYLVQMNAVRLLIRQLCVPTTDPSLEEETHCEILDLLRALSLGHERNALVQQFLFETPDIYLHKLAQLRPAVIKKTLQVLQQAAKLEENLQKFAETRHASPHNQMRISFASMIVHVLYISCEQLPTNQVIENVKIGELIHLSLATLQQLCHNRILLLEIAELLRQPHNLCRPSNLLLPAYVLTQQHITEENVTRSALGLIAQLVVIPEIVAIFSNNERLMQYLGQFSRSSSQALAAYAQQACSSIAQGGSTDVYRSYTGRPDPSHNYYYDQPQRNADIGARQSAYSNNRQQASTRNPDPRNTQYNHMGQAHSNQSIPGTSRIEPLHGDHSLPGSSIINESRPPAQHPQRIPDDRRAYSSQPRVDDWPDDLNDVHDTLNPFVNVFCGNDAINTPPFSPSLGYMPLESSSMDTSVQCSPQAWPQSTRPYYSGHTQSGQSTSLVPQPYDDQEQQTFSAHKPHAHLQPQHHHPSDPNYPVRPQHYPPGSYCSYDPGPSGMPPF